MPDGDKPVELTLPVAGRDVYHVEVDGDEVDRSEDDTLLSLFPAEEEEEAAVTFAGGVEQSVPVQPLLQLQVNTPITLVS